jgi:hypothetical protein
MKEEALHRCLVVAALLRKLKVLSLRLFVETYRNLVEQRTLKATMTLLPSTLKLNCPSLLHLERIVELI